MPHKILQREPKSNVIDLDKARTDKQTQDILDCVYEFAHLPSKERFKLAVEVNRYLKQLLRELGR